MIVVIADDLTGAAELAGIGLRYNLKVVIASDVDPTISADLLVLYTNSRSMRTEEAAKTMSEITAAARELKPELIYKKTDSVLRGHIVAEMKAQMEELNLRKGLLVPVNPHLGRTIKNGTYFIENVPVHLTGFSTDPEFQVISSSVTEMLGTKVLNTLVLNLNVKEITDGICIGEAETVEDVYCWTKFRTQDILLAGGASFFDALLKSIGYVQNKHLHPPKKLLKPYLLVSGTTFNINVKRIENYKDYVSYMPASIFFSDIVENGSIERWADKVITILSKYNKAIVAIGKQGSKLSDSTLLRKKASEVTFTVLNKYKIRELLVEGGSTAYSIILKLGFQSFYPTDELKPGVVRMGVFDIPDLFITIKPGSYQWPDEWDFN